MVYEGANRCVLGRIESKHSKSFRFRSIFSFPREYISHWNYGNHRKPYIFNRSLILSWFSAKFRDYFGEKNRPICLFSAIIFMFSSIFFCSHQSFRFSYVLIDFFQKFKIIEKFEEFSFSAQQSLFS